MSLTSLSKFLSLILRHKPETIGITLDDNGWADVFELICKMNIHGTTIDFETLEEIVRTDEKQRYSFNDDSTKIRANQGHSVNVDLEFKPVIPPDTLYHGTSVKNLNSISKNGIKPMDRLYVHLSKTYDIAKSVGNRHGKSIVLEINSKQMFEESVEIYKSENGVYLTKYVDPKYIFVRCEDVESYFRSKYTEQHHQNIKYYITDPINQLNYRKLILYIKHVDIDKLATIFDENGLSHVSRLQDAINKKTYNIFIENCDVQCCDSDQELSDLIEDGYKVTQLHQDENGFYVYTCN